MKRHEKEQFVSIAQLPNALEGAVRAVNVRDMDSASYSDDAIGALMDDLAMNGQTDPIMLEKAKSKDELPTIVRGYRRSIAIRRLNEKGIRDPQSGKTFGEAVRVVYVDDLTDLERIQLMIDQGQRRGLSPAEIVNVACRMFDNGAKEQDVVTQLRTLIDDVFPPKKKVENDEEYFTYRRGIVQRFHHIARAPDVLKEAALNKYRGKQNWPTDKDVETLSKIANKEFGESRQYNRKNPGPEFLAAWAELLAKVEESKNAGTRPKSISAMNGSQMEEAANQCTSVILKIAIDFCRNKVGRDQLPVFDEYLVKEIESKFTAEQRKFLESFGK